MNRPDLALCERASFAAVPPPPPPPTMKCAFAFVVVLVLALALSASAADSCAPLGDGEYTFFGVNKQTLLACYNSIPFSSANRDTLVKILSYTWDAYSFHDYVQKPLGSYDLQVRHLSFQKQPSFLLFPLSFAYFRSPISELHVKAGNGAP